MDEMETSLRIAKAFFNNVPDLAGAIRKMIEKSCQEHQLEYAELISGPYHDSLFVGRFAPTAMIFVPSKDGISHSPMEYTSYEELAAGADVLADVLLKLANETMTLEE